MRLNKAQQRALLRKWQQSDNGLTFLQFRRTVQPGYDCVMVQWCGMWLGIELDGYTHSVPLPDRYTTSNVYQRVKCGNVSPPAEVASYTVADPRDRIVERFWAPGRKPSG